MTIRRIMLLTLLAAFFAGSLGAQSLADSKDSAGGSATSPAATTTLQIDQTSTYTPPSQSVRLNNYIFDAFGPYPVIVAAAAAGINQATDAPPEWDQGAAGYGKRFGSDYGIALTDTSARYGLARLFKEDTLYYRCECTGILPRVRHAVFSTFTGRHGEDGHRELSIPSIVAPYAGTMTAVYGWYPRRYDAKDAFRMGNYGLLGYMGANIGLEFFYSGPHSLLSRVHLNNPNAAPEPGPNP
jgi:hypothetical protein